MALIVPDARPGLRMCQIANRINIKNCDPWYKTAGILEMIYRVLYNIAMNNTSPRDQISDDILAALRRIIRAIDLQSRQLVRSHGLTGPQALLLKEIMLAESITVGQLAERVSLSQATVTDILLRLERRDLIERQRAQDDKRRVLVRITTTGRTLMKRSVPLLQESFVDRLNQLQSWEQTQLLASMQRLAEMMNEQAIDSSDEPYKNGDKERGRRRALQ